MYFTLTFFKEEDKKQKFELNQIFNGSENSDCSESGLKLITKVGVVQKYCDCKNEDDECLDEHDKDEPLRTEVTYINLIDFIIEKGDESNCDSETDWMEAGAIIGELKKINLADPNQIKLEGVDAYAEIQSYIKKEKS